MAMISIEGRPKTWEDVHGQKVCTTLLKNIVASPESSPKCILVYGSFGSGKTTCARIFASKLNHMEYDDLVNSPFLQEYDSSQLDATTIKKVMEGWYTVPSYGYRVIVLDEVHLLTPNAMSALLKVFEDTPSRTFFYMATTDPEKVLDTIRSRSLEIKIDTLSDEDMRENILDKAQKFNVNIDSEEVIQRIIEISKGHPRTADMELSKYDMLGTETYLSLFKSAYSEIASYFGTFGSFQNKNRMMECIDNILTFPLSTIKDDMDKYILDSIKGVALKEGGTNLSIRANKSIYKIYNMMQQSWFKSSYDSDVELRCALLILWNQFSPKPEEQKTAAPVQTESRRR